MSRKTVDTWEIHVDYGQGWEHECTEFSSRDAHETIRLYRENCPYPVKLVRRRLHKSKLTEYERAHLPAGA